MKKWLIIYILRCVSNLIPLLVFLLLTGNCFAQHIEYNFAAGSGLFHYVSDKSDRMEPFYSMLNISSDPIYPVNPYANNPEGGKSGLSFQFSTTIKKVTRHNFIRGLDAEFQSLQSKKKLLYIFSDSIYNANGQCKLRNRYIDLFPYFGRRLIIKKIYLDIAGGFELAMNFFDSHEIDHAVMISTGRIFKAGISSRSGAGSLAYDVRFRLQSLLGFDKHWGLSLGYAWGLTNLDGEGRPNHCHSRYARIGIAYTLQGKNKSKPH